MEGERLRGGADGLPPTTEEVGERIIALLLLVEAVSVFLLWNVDSLSPRGQDVFAVFLAVELVAFATMSYIYRTLNSGGEISRLLVVAGSCFIAAIFFVGLSLPG